MLLPVHAQSFTNSCYYQCLNNLIKVLVITNACRNLYKYLLLQVPAKTSTCHYKWPQKFVQVLVTTGACRTRINTCYYKCLQKLVLVITSPSRNCYKYMLLQVRAECCEAYSPLFQVQRLAQYEQYFESILRESRHDHADHEDVSRAAAKAKQVGDILKISCLFYTRRIYEKYLKTRRNIPWCPLNSERSILLEGPNASSVSLSGVALKIRIITQTEENLSTQKQTCPSATSFTTYLT